MATDQNKNKVSQVGTTVNGVTKSKVVPLVVVDGRVTGDITVPRIGVYQ